MNSKVLPLASIQSASDIHVMVNMLSDVGFKREWVACMTTTEDVEIEIFRLVKSYKGTKEERLRIFHLIQIWGGYSGRNIYLNNPDGFVWDKIDSFYKELINVCKKTVDVSEESRNKIYDAIALFDKNVPHIGVSFITKHTRFWLYDEGVDKMLPIYDSVMVQNYYRRTGNQLKDLLGYWKKMCNDKNRNGRTLCQYERDLYNEFKPHKECQMESR